MALAQSNGAGVTGCQRLVLSAAATVPDRTDGVDDTRRRQLVAGGDLGIAGLATMEPAAFLEQFWSSSTVDRAIDPAAAQKRRVGGVDDGINAQGRDIGDNDFQPYLADQAQTGSGGG